MKIDPGYLYDLLPAYYRVVDDEKGRPLKAFIEILAREGALVEENITRLYENWFIETCDEWVVPYIGDLLKVKNINEIEDASVYSRRAYIANTLGYRRRKGTAPVLEQIAFDITGWSSKVVEFFQLLSTAQNLNHVRLHNTVTPELRQMNKVDLINTGFDQQSHTIDVRRIETSSGLYNIMNIGIYLWRLESYPMKNVDARLIPAGADVPDAAFTFSPLGIDTQLFNNPQTEKSIVQLAEEINVPAELRRRALYDELENVRQTLVDGGTPVLTYFNETYPPVFQLFINGNSTPVPPEEIAICNLESWHQPPTSKNYKKYHDDGTISIIPMPITASVDPILGRIAFSDPVSITDLTVNYSYGFSGDIGGGPYDRISSLSELDEITFDWQVGVSIDHSAVQTESIYQSLQEAIDDWNSPDNKNVGLITIMDNRSYEKAVTDDWEINIPEGKRLYIIAAEWPAQDDPSGVPGLKVRNTGTYNPEDLRPHLKGDITIQGTAPSESSSGGAITINGLLIEGKISIENGNLGGCKIAHSTLVPDNGGVTIMEQASILNFDIKQSICGQLNVTAEDAVILISECIIDHKPNPAISILKGQLAIDRSTIYGEVESQSLDASNSIFMNELIIERRQIGCVRFSYVPVTSKTPRRYRCQPELEINTQIKFLEEEGPVTNAEKLAIKEHILSWLFPVFTSNSYGDQAFAQLQSITPDQIKTGGDNGSEMGVYNRLQQPQREANLNIVLEEYLRLGLDAGIIYVT